MRACLLKRNHKKYGQTLLEYTIVIALVAAATIAMFTYVMRSVQDIQTQIQEESQ